MRLERLLKVARGDEPADLVLRNGHVINVFTGEVVMADVALAGETIAGLGEGYVGRAEIDLGGRYVCPGLIDAHVHIESSLVTPFEFARAVVPRGTTTVVADPHEIANVAGADGVRTMIAASDGLPLSVFIMLPSCVPATHLATAGAALAAADLLALSQLPRVVGLAEFMNVPGAVLGLPGALEKLEGFAGRVVDGHAPGVSGKWLQAYVAAGPGSDHEATSAEEMLEKLRAGMRIFVREATSAKNLRALVPAITLHNSRRCAFATDDRHPGDLLDEGHVDHLVRLAVEHGLDAITALQMATLHAAEAFRLYDRGALGPGKRADLVVFSNLKEFRAEMVFVGGRLVARDGHPVGDWQAPAVEDSALRQTVRVDWERLDLAVPAPGSGRGKARVIRIIPDQIVTEQCVEELPVVDGVATAAPERDIAKLAVVERHHASGSIGLGFVRGLGLRRGALAGSVGHDAHNLIVAGCDDASMGTALRAVARSGGGLVVAAGDEVLASLPLPVAGLMSDQPLERVRGQLERLLRASRELGCALRDPFMTLSFLPLEVIPALKLTDRGLVDVERFDFVPLWVE
jgi:adenine deaminase